MRYHDIFEAPIADLGQITIGGSTSFDKADRHLLSSDRANARFFKSFEKTPFVFKVYFVHNDKFDAEDDGTNNNVDHHLRKQDGGIHEGEFKFPSHPKDGEEQRVFKPEDGVITVIMLGNLSSLTKSSAPRMPMTPWTLAHKIGHAFYEPYGGYKTTGYAPLVDALRALRDYENMTHSRQMMTMRSARKRLLNNDFEDVAELVAQYLITGKVTLGVSDGGKARAQKINSMVRDLISEAVGKIIVEM